MYQSKKNVSSKSLSALKTEVRLFIHQNEKVYCKALKRTVSLQRALECLTENPKSAKHRLGRFLVAIDILGKETMHQQKTVKGKRCFEIIGKDRSGIEIRIHLREEMSDQKDRILYFISSY